MCEYGLDNHRMFFKRLAHALTIVKLGAPEWRHPMPQAGRHVDQHHVVAAAKDVAVQGQVGGVVTFKVAGLHGSTALLVQLAQQATVLLCHAQRRVARTGRL